MKLTRRGIGSRERLLADARALLKPLIILVFLWAVHESVLPSLPSARLNRFLYLRDAISIVIQCVELTIIVVFLLGFKRLVGSASVYSAFSLGAAWPPTAVKCLGYIFAVTVGYFAFSVVINNTIVTLNASLPFDAAIVNTLITLSAVAIGTYAVGKVLLREVPTPTPPIPIPPPELSVQEVQSLLEKLDERLTAGDISEGLYKELKSKYWQKLAKVKREEEELEKYRKEAEVLKVRYEIGEIDRETYKKQRAELDKKILEARLRSKKAN